MNAKNCISLSSAELPLSAARSLKGDFEAESVAPLLRDIEPSCIGDKQAKEPVPIRTSRLYTVCHGDFAFGDIMPPLRHHLPRRWCIHVAKQYRMTSVPNTLLLGKEQRSHAAVRTEGLPHA